ncbi:type 2C protein phosphatase PTC7 [Ascoidea rubescens DSM 1968]|uniref:Protein phosphatase n=1 Tax=Ascoidea rubescens DSM 1968 TaxID=1344418 RepID=A0A1D2VKH5_9ASCO|nr:protein serine/threonine phosphatase 2C [Ascoidea rubescens DSM 1968]ODV62109.1 protein serine/threonine phosphatase 2C [Ascoidea rubescens DSM 1968]
MAKPININCNFFNKFNLITSISKRSYSSSPLAFISKNTCNYFNSITNNNSSNNNNNNNISTINLNLNNLNTSNSYNYGSLSNIIITKRSFSSYSPFFSSFSSPASSSSSSSFFSSSSNSSGSSTSPPPNPQNPSNSLNYNIVVAFSPKDREENGFFENSISNTSNKSPTGEDNYFISEKLLINSNGYKISIGVADGVGGWAEMGYDSSAISRELCNSIKYIFENSDNDQLIDLNPKFLLNLAFNYIKSDKKVHCGGTTACLGILSSNGELKVANLGDSWMGVFRDFKCIHQTKFQTHRFNTPYQLSIIPPKLLEQARRQNKKYLLDSPLDSQEYSFKLQKNDIIIFATDGITDNILVPDIEIYLKDQYNENINVPLQQVANTFVQNVKKLSYDEDFPSPFSQELRAITGQPYLGGKPDDITTVFIKVE